jgi:Domain of unknown function (DUF4432)
VPVAWSAPAPVRGPAFAEHGDLGWLQTFAGGLTVICGLDHYGSPCRDDGQELGLHGRASTLVAQHLSSRSDWTADSGFELEVSATCARRACSAKTSHCTARVQRVGLGRDPHPGRGGERVARAAAHMLLYHVNLGWPLVDDGTTVDLPSQAVAARDAAAEEAVSAWRPVDRPRPDRGELVLRHELPTGQTIEVVVSDPRLGLELALGFDTRQLPHLFIWRMLRSGADVLGLEPATTPVIEGRARARELGLLPVLEPGGTRATPSLYRAPRARRGSPIETFPREVWS